MVSEQTVEEFRDAVKHDHGRDLSFEEARAVLLGWVAHFNLLAKIDSRISPKS